MSPVDNDVPWDLVSHFKASTTRQEVLFYLYNTPSHAAEIAEEFNLNRGTISNHIRWMKKTDPPVVECLTPERPHHRIYGVTEIGEKVAQELAQH